MTEHDEISKKIEIATSMVHCCTLEELERAEKIFVHKIPEGCMRKDPIRLVAGHYEEIIQR